MSFGAAVLASRATVKSGVGLCTAHIASSGNDIMQISLPEAMLSLDDEADFITKIPSDDKYNAIGIGPGIGTNIQTIAALVSFLNENKKPLVIDADGINCLAMVNNFLELLPQNTILTPHMKEFDRMFGNHNSVYERLQTQKKISKKYGVIIVLKGAHTAVSNSNGDIWFNTMGNPGMATGGSGDVLTGIVTGLRAGSYTAFDAALLGVYIHGLAGDLALVDESHETLIASDIISHLSNAFKFVK
jgi:NAD(P)H-hydrate epimerase